MFFFCFTADIADCSESPNSGTDQVKALTINNQSVKTLCKADGWTVIQSRGQFPAFPKDYFSTKLWKEYQAGFGTPGIKYGFIQVILSKTQTLTLNIYKKKKKSGVFLGSH